MPTYNSHSELTRLLASLDVQTLDHDLVIVDSSSCDGTAELGRSRADIFIPINQRDFNHGGTRQMVVDLLVDHDVLVFLTQDAELVEPEALAKLVACFDDRTVGAACGRQLPHQNANPFAEHARLFNYPAEGRVVDRNNLKLYGLKAAFMSNSFAAYLRTALVAAGGFPTNVILAEDMYVAARMVMAGWKIVYASEAMCRHSHNYTVKEEAQRYFDTGVFHARETWIRSTLGGTGGEGRRYVVSELRFLGLRRARLWPASLWRNAAKLAGYKLGQAEEQIPLPLKRRWSMHRGFWK
ncbi:glycosyltransferase [Sphingomonas ginsenosidivorax]|uniref:glycosyltransferase n=1 Tax=Sphingomonas ginsenosidivorax TaxID=862135 RepID=UPI0018F3E6BF|nr:glycosyltransferase [Sphingomonas ginsenosidivorax]